MGSKLKLIDTSGRRLPKKPRISQTDLISDGNTLNLQTDTSTKEVGKDLYVEMTYSELISSISGSTLVPGQKILLTDYQTVHYIQYSGPSSGGTGNEEVNVGAIEPLLLTVTSNNTISQFADSLTYPQDTILYSPTMADGNYEYVAAQGKGCITFRKDNPLSISRDYDWRTVLFRRWETVIGNGNFWSYTPVAGAAFQDSLGLGSNVQVAGNVNIGSVKAAGAIIGVPYWLDNTIFNLETILGVTMSFTFGNTFTYFDDAGGVLFEFNSSITVKNVVVQNFAAINFFGDFTNNNIIQTLNGQVGMQGNSVGGGCAENNIADFYLNAGGGIDGNTCVLMASNTASRIVSNTATEIIGNNVSVIQENTIAGEITANVGVQIKNNVAANISNNMVNNIEGNSVLNIDGNVCDLIENNTDNVTEITGNIGTLVSNCSNVGGIIYNNFANAIQNISGSGDLDSCSGAFIDGLTLNGDFKSSYNITIYNVTITAPIINTNFNGKIISKTLNPTLNMQSGSSAVVKFDFGLGDFVEEILTSGTTTYSAAITS